MNVNNINLDRIECTKFNEVTAVMAVECSMIINSGMRLKFPVKFTLQS